MPPLGKLSAFRAVFERERMKRFKVFILFDVERYCWYRDALPPVDLLTKLPDNMVVSTSKL
jgi:hypothetical protein